MLLRRLGATVSSAILVPGAVLTSGTAAADALPSYAQAVVRADALLDSVHLAGDPVRQATPPDYGMVIDDGRVVDVPRWLHSGVTREVLARRLVAHPPAGLHRLRTWHVAPDAEHVFPGATIVELGNRVVGSTPAQTLRVSAYDSRAGGSDVRLDAVVAWVGDAPNSGTDGVLAGDAHSKAQAKVRAEEVWRRAQLAGATPISPTRVRDFTLTDNAVVAISRSFRVDASPDTLVHRLRLKPPRGFAAPSPSTHKAGATSVRFVLADRQNSSMHTIDVVAKRDSHGDTRVYVEADARWVPPRPSLAVLSPAVSKAWLRFEDRDGDSPGRTTRNPNAATVRRLVAAINALPEVSPQDLTWCPATDPDVVHLDVTNKGFPLQLTVEMGGCHTISANLGGLYQYRWGFDQQVVAQLQALFGHH